MCLFWAKVQFWKVKNLAMATSIFKLEVIWLNRNLGRRVGPIPLAGARSPTNQLKINQNWQVLNREDVGVYWSRSRYPLDIYAVKILASLAEG